MGPNNAFPSADSLYPDLNERMRELELGYIMSVMKRLFPTYSDTPGMGNQTPWTILGSNIDDPYGMKQMKFTNKMTGLPMNERMGLEKMMLDRGLHDDMESLQYWGNRPRQSQQQEMMRLPGLPTNYRFRM